MRLFLAIFSLVPFVVKNSMLAMKQLFNHEKHEKHEKHEIFLKIRVIRFRLPSLKCCVKWVFKGRFETCPYSSCRSSISCLLWLKIRC